jgi:hypothetical protein
MARYRKVDPRIWNDAGFRQLSDSGKLAFLFLITHPNMTSLGAMRATLPGLAAELEWSAEDFREAFGEALQQGMVEHDGKAHLVALPNFIRYNAPESPNVVRAWVGAVDLLPECDLKTLVLQRAKASAEGLSKAFAQAFGEAFAKAMPNQEQEQKQEQTYPPSHGEQTYQVGRYPGRAPRLGRGNLAAVAGRDLDEGAGR